MCNSGHLGMIGLNASAGVASGDDSRDSDEGKPAGAVAGRSRRRGRRSAAVPSPTISPSRLFNRQMSFSSNRLISYFENISGYKLRRPRPCRPARATVRPPPPGRLRRGASVEASRVDPPEGPCRELQQTSTRTRAKSCAIIAALDEISGLEQQNEAGTPVPHSTGARRCLLALHAIWRWAETASRALFAVGE